MIGIVFYLVVAAIVVVAAFLLAEWIRQPGIPAPDHPGALAVIAGLLWPVLAVGLVQWVLVAAVHRKMRRAVVPVPPARVDVKV